MFIGQAHGFNKRFNVTLFYFMFFEGHSLKMRIEIVLIIFSLGLCRPQIVDEETAVHMLKGTQSVRIEQLSYKRLCQCQCKDLTVFNKEKNRYFSFLIAVQQIFNITLAFCGFLFTIYYSLSVCLYVCMSVCLYVCMSVCPYAYLYVCMSICLSVCL